MKSSDPPPLIRATVSTDGRAPLLVVGIALLPATAFKLWLALTTVGTNDVYAWQAFMEYIVKNGSVTIYRDIGAYNHPPLISLLLRAMSPLARHAPNGVPFVIRLPAIAADVVSSIVVFRLVRLGWTERRALVCAVGVALNPILIMVSGFHGNTDPVFMSLVLLAADRLLIAESPLTAGLLLGLSINVKLVPLLVVPVFLFHLRGLAARTRFCVGLAMVLAVGYGYHVWMAYPFIRRNVFGYGGQRGEWGLGELFGAGWPFIKSPQASSWLKLIIGVVITVRAAILARLRGPSEAQGLARQLLVSIGWAFLIFMLMTPGFGIQYLAWLAIASFLISPAGGVVYGLVGGSFMFSVYHYWNRGFPWNIADSDAVGLWGDAQVLLGRVTWLFLVFWAASMIRDALAHSRGWRRVVRGLT